MTLVPHDAWWLATFYGDDARRPFDIYVDIATPATWHDDHLVRAVDLDLDVIRGTTGRVWVDDEDEFAAHRVELDYPDEVVEQAVRSAADAARRGHRRAAPPSTAPTSPGWTGCAGLSRCVGRRPQRRGRDVER